MQLSRRQEFELLTAIKGRGEIPLKFAYIGEGAANWNRVARQRDEFGGVNRVERALLSQKASAFIDALPHGMKINVIDVGCGNGRPCIPILRELTDRNILFRYIPIDISQRLLDLAENTVHEEFPGTETKKMEIDFELGNFSDLVYELKDDRSVNLLLFLGTTLGNFSDRTRILSNFRDSMTATDFLLIGVELTNVTKHAKLVRHYEEQNATDFLRFVPDEIGISQTDATLDVQWNDGTGEIEIRIILNRDISASIGSEVVPLEIGESILLAKSAKFNQWSITKLLSTVGFRLEYLTTNADISYALAMVQSTRL